MAHDKAAFAALLAIAGTLLINFFDTLFGYFLLGAALAMAFRALDD